MNAPEPLYAPDYRIEIDGGNIPAALRGAITSVSLQTGLEGADRVELDLINENLRWLDHDLLRIGNPLALAVGYAPEALEQLFVGEIVAQSASFPSGGAPTLNVAAQDRRHRMQTATRARWYAVPVTGGNAPLPDSAVASAVAAEGGFVPIEEPIGAALAVLIGGVEAVAAVQEGFGLQKLIRKQIGQSDYDFLARIGSENGWEMLVDHGGPLGGTLLRFLSPSDALSPALTLRYGASLLEFTPRLSEVGQIARVSGTVWQPDIKREFTVTLGWSWERQALELSIDPGGATPSGEDLSLVLVDEPLSLASAPRVFLSKLLPVLNQRLTGYGSTIGDPRIRAGEVLRLEGVGEQFGGLYRVAEATHSLDSGGYRTSFELRKEIWFGSIPAIEQGAIPVQPLGQVS